MVWRPDAIVSAVAGILDPPAGRWIHFQLVPSAWSQVLRIWREIASFWIPVFAGMTLLRTIAPAPSPNNMAVSLSPGSTNLDFTSAAITSAVSIWPLLINISAMFMEYKKPEHDALMSKAAAFLAPMFFCTMQAVDGMNISWEVVDSTMSLSSSTATPADFRADNAARVA